MIPRTDDEAISIFAEFTEPTKIEATRIYNECRKQGMEPRDAVRHVMREIVREWKRQGGKD